MKVAITGHTSGIGLELFNIFPDSLGFSRSNGYNIGNNFLRQKIINESKDCDVFINNAYHEWSQVHILSQLWNEWKDKNKIIVCMGSGTTEYPHAGGDEYTLHKIALEESCKQLRLANKPCKVILIKPGWIDTKRVKSVQAIKIDPKELALCIKDIILNVEKSLWIPEITIYPK